MGVGRNQVGGWEGFEARLEVGDVPPRMREACSGRGAVLHRRQGSMSWLPSNERGAPSIHIPGKMCFLGEDRTGHCWDVWYLADGHHSVGIGGQDCGPPRQESVTKGFVRADLEMVNRAAHENLKRIVETITDGEDVKLWIILEGRTPRYFKCREKVTLKKNILHPAQEHQVRKPKLRRRRGGRKSKSHILILSLLTQTLTLTYPGAQNSPTPPLKIVLCEQKIWEGK